MQKILIIEDEPELVKVLRSYLESSGFEVLTSLRGDTGLQLWESSRPDLVLLDLNLPGMNGLDVAKAIHKKANTPIIMLTARVEETDRLIGLELGADDYVTKPYSPREVVARVRAVLRRAGGQSELKDQISIGGLEIDFRGHAVKLDGEEIEITPTEFDILKTLIEQPGRVFSRIQILQAIQDEPVIEGYERTVDAHIKNLRSKIEPDPKQPFYIETVFGVGYKFSKEEKK
jgi:DNA-binding response OmpR family regulator